MVDQLVRGESPKTLQDLARNTHMRQKTALEARRNHEAEVKRLAPLRRTWYELSHNGYEFVPSENDRPSWDAFARRLAPKIIAFARAIVETGYLENFRRVVWNDPREEMAAVAILQGMTTSDEDLAAALLATFADWSQPEFANGIARPEGWPTAFNTDDIFDRILAATPPTPKSPEPETTIEAEEQRQPIDLTSERCPSEPAAGSSREDAADVKTLPANPEPQQHPSTDARLGKQATLLLGYLVHHHGFDDEGVETVDAAKVQGLATKHNVNSGVISRAFKELFPSGGDGTAGHDNYVAICRRGAGAVFFALQALRAEGPSFKTIVGEIADE